MPVNPLVLELLEDVAESGRSPEEVCKDRPELLGEVRAWLRHLTSVRDELDALFPEDDGDGSAPTWVPQGRPEIPGYRVGDILGRGGMGVVYEARHLRLNRPVAIKMMLNGGFAGRPELARFQREAEALAALEHPNIVRIYDVGESGGLPYFAMEFVAGGNLAQTLGGVPQSARDVAALGVLLAGAVEAAHRGGIVHRDLKPSNILLTADGSPKITDFGLARRFDAGAGLSMTGARIGTPAYMAPEQAAGLARVSGAATDVYSLGAILYEMLTGRPPFVAATAAETERQVIAEEPAPPSRLNAQVPRDLETICLKCLRKEPNRRYSSAAELGEDLGRFLRDEPIKARPAGSIERAGKWLRRHPARAITLSGGLAIAVALLIGGWWLISARLLVAREIEGELRVATRALRGSNWAEARSALERARGRLGRGDYGELRRRLDRAGRDYELVARLAEIRVNRIYINQILIKNWSVAYEDAFRTSGLLDVEEAPRVAADRLVASDIKDALVAAIDDWALCASYVADARREAWLLDVAKLADPDLRGWRDRFRDPSVRRDRKALESLAASARMVETPVNLLVSLGDRLQDSGGDAIPLLLSVQRLHPDDLWVNFLLGYYALKRNDAPEALRNFQAALATRPDAPFLHHLIAVAFHKVGKLDESLAYSAKAAQLNPDDPEVRLEFGERLVEAGRLPEAIAQFDGGLALARDPAQRSMLRKGLRRCRALLGDVEGLDAIWRKSLEATPPNYEDWDEYAEFCLYNGRLDAYRSTCRGLIEHFGATKDARIAERAGRACLLAPVSGEVLAGATALVDRALSDEGLKSDWIHPYFMFAKGLAEYRHGRLESSIAIMDRQASPELQPGPRLVSAMARHRLGREHAAIGTLATAILSRDWKETRADGRETWIFQVLRREAESMMLPNLRAFLEGKYRPRSSEEWTCFLGACQFERRYRAAAGIYSEILASEPRLAGDLNSKTRYLAACAAASAGAGRGLDAGTLDESERFRRRKQARDWLRADLGLARKLAETDSVGLREFLQFTLRAWLTDPDLAGLRDPDACKGLLPSEQQEFRRLCEALRILIIGMKN